MNAATIAQAVSSQARLVALASELAESGLLAAAEIVAGGALSLSVLLRAVTPPAEVAPVEEPAKEPARLESV